MARKKQKISYSEGSCIAIPLRGGGYAIGVIARMNGKGGVFGYFFGPKRKSIESIGDISSLKSQEAILVGRFGDLGLLNDEWKVIGKISDWDRSKWPMPGFIRVDEFSNRAWISYYDEEDFTCIREEEVSPDLKEKYPYDSGMGYGAVEIRLTKLLEGS